MRFTKKQGTFLALVAVLLFCDAMIRQHNGQGGDFLCYYTAGERLLHGKTLYVATDERPFKYPPFVALYFVPYALMRFEVARWVWTAVHALLVLLAPLLIWGIVRRDSRYRDEATPNRAIAALCVAILGTLRFVDSEFFVSQITLGAYVALPLAVFLTTLRWGKFFAPVVMGLGSVVKVHSLAAGLSLAPERSRGTLMAMLAFLALIVFVPDPRLWLAWAEQMRATTIFGFSETSFNLQGFYPFGVVFLRLPQHSILPALTALPFAAVAWLRLPRFTVDEIALAPARFLLAASTWFLLAILASPLPWQYTYAVLWPLFFLSWLVGTRLHRGVLLALALFLGLTPKGLAGVPVMVAIEGRQLIFAAIVGYWVLLWWQAASTVRDVSSRKSAIYIPGTAHGF